METPVISYNLRERGRVLTGVPRDFDVPRIVAAINSAECQERVKLRDMIGYYGHWARVRFGLNPAEGGIDSGKTVSIEPAIVTTFLRADADGTIHHKQEFLPTKAGQLARQLHESKVGGFSSAIDNKAPKYHGSDYVLNANYVTNRGYTLDSAFNAACDGGVCSLGMTLDDVDSAIYGEQLAGIQQLLDSANMMHRASLLTIEGMREELSRLRISEAEYLSIITRLKADKERLEAVTLDSGVGKIPLMLHSGAAERMRRTAHEFRSAKLIFPEDPDKRMNSAPEMSSLYNQMLGRYSNV